MESNLDIWYTAERKSDQEMIHTVWRLDPFRHVNLVGGLICLTWNYTNPYVQTSQAPQANMFQSVFCLATKASRIAQIFQTHKDLLKHHSKIPILGAPLLACCLDVLTRPGHESLTLTRIKTSMELAKQPSLHKSCITQDETQEQPEVT